MLHVDILQDGSVALIMPRSADVSNVVQAFKYYNHRWNPQHIKQDLLEGIPKQIVHELEDASLVLMKAEVNEELSIVYDNAIYSVKEK